MRSLLVAALLAPVPATAFPDGPPWDAVAGRGCAECHFGGDLVEESSALRVEGLPARIVPGKLYRLTLILDDPSAAAAGYLLAIRDGEGEAGTLRAPGPGSETRGALARSTAPDARTWQLEWQAPARPVAGLRLEFWANAADGDGSPFGDRIHRKAIGIDGGT